MVALTGAVAVVLAAISAALVAGRRANPLAVRFGEGILRAGAGAGAGVDRRPQAAASGRPTRRGLPGEPSRRVQIVLGALAGAVLGGLLAPLGGLVAGVVAVPAAAMLHAKRCSRRAARRRATDVVDGCLALAGELGSGTQTHQALVIVATDWPELFAVAARQTMIGGDPAAALRESAGRPGAEALTAVAAAWEVSERTGAKLSSVLGAVADSLRAESAVQREAEAQLASVRATSRLMAVLPLATLALFSTGGGGALRFLTGTPYGLMCMVSAAALIVAGLFWVDRIARVARSAWLS